MKILGAIDKIKTYQRGDIHSFLGSTAISAKRWSSARTKRIVHKTIPAGAVLAHLIDVIIVTVCWTCDCWTELPLSSRYRRPASEIIVISNVYRIYRNTTRTKWLGVMLLLV